ncbi:GntR family transcriptional regulator [Cognatishimia maritima]|uniref:Transcriptional regulator, GntR family n=1 Tax=Cognatishimia maritima TaxID=870908 RepID=A0A1M5N9I6_9RHOB|nr:GntR family transcriptional regulator [Cognatishimia maritima]SHG86112.1 transcriptional regulator, GntR family [Cognatishimia maritima]
MKDAAQKSLSNSQRALQELRRMIFAGELAGGTDHLESELADRLGMSRTPIREAALTLENQGLLELRPRKGVRILPVSPSDMREIYEVLTALESQAAEQAAQRGYSEADLSELAAAIEDMDRAVADQDLEAWAEADNRFHAELVRLGDNNRVASIFNMMNDQVRRARMTTLYIRPVPTKSNADHRAVYEAIRQGDAETARRRHREHRQHAKEILIELLEKHRLNRL